MVIPKKESFQDPLGQRRGKKDDLEIDVHCFLTTTMRSRVRSQTVNTLLHNKVKVPINQNKVVKNQHCSRIVRLQTKEEGLKKMIFSMKTNNPGWQISQKSKDTMLMKFRPSPAEIQMDNFK